MASLASHIKQEWPKKVQAGRLGLVLMMASSVVGGEVKGEDLDLSRLPSPAEVEVDFARDIQPMLESSCLRCHGPEKPKSGYRLDNRADALNSGNEGPNIIPGDSEGSALIHYVAHLVEDMEMPPPGKVVALTSEQIALLRAWIDQGALWSQTEPLPDRETTVTPMFGWYFVDGDKDLFREHHGVEEGVQGGLQEFSYLERLDEKTRLQMEGHTLRNDYKVQLSLERREVGFLRAGFEQYQRYYDNSGGYYEPFTPPMEELNRELFLELGKAWFEVGLDRPGLPQVVLGYEFSYKNGDKATTHWLPVTQVGSGGLLETRNIFPAAKNIDEKVHVVQLDVDHTMAGIDWADQFRFEYFDLNNSQRGVLPFANNANGDFVDTREDYDQYQLANTFTGQKQVNDWLLLSSGYLYSHVDGDNTLEQKTVDGAGNPAFGNYWSEHGLTLKKWAHVFNMNAQLGPWNGFTLVAGVLPEFSHQEGSGDVNYDEGLPPLTGTDLRPGYIKGDSDRVIVEEQVTLRYFRIPRTILFGEARLRQEDISLFERKDGTPSDTVGDFRRDTDASNQLWDYRGGLRVSPWSRVSWGGHYRKRIKNNDYDNHVDEAFGGFPGTGYSAFITAQDTDTDEVETRMVWRPLNWLKSTLGFQWQDTDYVTQTDAAFPFAPGGTLGDAGNSRARTYSVNAIMTPLSRLYLSTTLAYTDSRIKTFSNNSPAVAPYEGDILSVIANATYVLNEKTEAMMTYAFSHGDYSQNNVAGGLPLGLKYDQNTLLVGLKRRLTPRLVSQLQYGFYKYSEDSSGGRNDYTGHGVFTSLSMVLP